MSERELPEIKIPAVEIESKPHFAQGTIAAISCPKAPHYVIGEQVDKRGRHVHVVFDGKGHAIFSDDDIYPCVKFKRLMERHGYTGAL